MLAAPSTPVGELVRAAALEVTDATPVRHCSAVRTDLEPLTNWTAIALGKEDILAAPFVKNRTHWTEPVRGLGFAESPRLREILTYVPDRGLLARTCRTDAGKHRRAAVSCFAGECVASSGHWSCRFRDSSIAISSFDDHRLTALFYVDAQDGCPYIVLRSYDDVHPQPSYSRRGAHELCITRLGSSLRFNRWSHSQDRSQPWATMYFLTWEGMSPIWEVQFLSHLSGS